jgi:uncharacterized iron-regulated protein
MRILFAAITTLLFVMNLFGQIPYQEDQFSIFDAEGKPATMDQLITALGGAEAVFLGEQHDDAVGHAVQAEIFRRVVAKYANDRRIALSLEMFERDVQIVVDEYLSGLITEAQFMASSRPWGNYKTDYRPLVELAKERHFPVIAANAPRRYINMVSRGGRSKLEGLSKEAKAWLPRLPYAEPSPAYAAKFKGLMGQSPEAQMGIDNILASQSLWDAAMADAVARFVKSNDKGLVIHLNGGFHAESRLGTVDHLLAYRPKTKVLVINIKYEDDFRSFNAAKHARTGDFVILTDAKVPRSKR